MSEQFNDTRDVVRQAIPMSNFSRPFWDATRAKKLLLQYCPVAQAYQFFPRPVSIFTGRRNLEWREVSGRAALYSYTIADFGPGPFRSATPYVVIMAELDEGVRMISNLVAPSRDEIRVGMRLRVHWLALEDGTHLPLFEADPSLG